MNDLMEQLMRLAYNRHLHVTVKSRFGLLWEIYVSGALKDRYGNFRNTRKALFKIVTKHLPKGISEAIERIKELEAEGRFSYEVAKQESYEEWMSR